MKKLLGILCCLSLCVTSWAAACIGVEAAKQRIQRLELIEQKAFQWCELEYDEPDWIELRALAKQVYEQNPNSFNAAYNYGVVTYAIWEPEIGPVTREEILSDAFDAFEHARALVPNKEMLFEREYHLLYLWLVGGGVPFDDSTTESLFQTYSSETEKAGQMLFAIERLFSLKGFDLTKKVHGENYQTMALQAFIIKLAKEDYEGAKQFLPALGGTKKLREIRQAEREEGQIINGKYAKALKKAGIDLTLNTAEVTGQIMQETNTQMTNLMNEFMS